MNATAIGKQGVNEKKELKNLRGYQKSNVDSIIFHERVCFLNQKYCSSSPFCSNNPTLEPDLLFLSRRHSYVYGDCYRIS